MPGFAPVRQSPKREVTADASRFVGSGDTPVDASFARNHARSSRHGDGAVTRVG